MRKVTIKHGGGYDPRQPRVNDPTLERPLPDVKVGDQVFVVREYDPPDGPMEYRVQVATVSKVGPKTFELARSFSAATSGRIDRKKIGSLVYLTKSEAVTAFSVMLVRERESLRRRMDENTKALEWAHTQLIAEEATNGGAR